jgi:flagellum-specific peptidoglycan hydrolase FlgJ
LTEKEAAFLKLVAGPALECERTSKIPAAITIAQAIIETTAQVNGVWTWGASHLFTKANNPFGIKFSHQANSAGYGQYDTPTAEFINGKKQIIEAGFVSYPTLATAFKDHARLLWTAHYAEFIYWSARCPAAIDAACQSLGPKTSDIDRLHCGYSTNPKYGDLLMTLIREFHLDDAAALTALAQPSVVSGQSSVAGNMATPTDVATGDL